MLLSLIVPMYNVERYIEACLHSIAVQLPPNNDVEIILVDDGSPDKTYDVVQEFLNLQPTHVGRCFKIIRQKNMGLSEARNNALKIAKGNYIGFIDSDDIIASDYISSILSVLLNGKNVDIIRFDFLRFKETMEDSYKEKGEGVSQKIKEEGLIENNEYFLRSLFSEGKWYAWLNIYKKELFDNIWFPKGVYFEDVCVVPLIYEKSQRIFILKNYLYYYRFNGASILNDKSLKNIEKQLDSHLYIIDWVVKQIEKGKILYSTIFVRFFLGYLLLLSRYRANHVFSEFVRYRYILKKIDVGMLSQYYKIRVNNIYVYLLFLMVKSFFLKWKTK